MKTKLTLSVAVLAAALFGIGCASTGNTTLAPSRNVLLRGPEMINFRLVGNVAIIENATGDWAKLIGTSVSFIPADDRTKTTHIMRIPNWMTSWVFSPDGTVKVYESDGATFSHGIEVQGKTLIWPKKPEDSKIGDTIFSPQTRDMLVRTGNEIQHLRIEGDQVIWLNNGRKGSFAEYNNGYYKLSLQTWTSDWTFFPDGTAALKESPWSRGQNYAIPVNGSTAAWPK